MRRSVLGVERGCQPSEGGRNSEAALAAAVEEPASNSLQSKITEQQQTCGFNAWSGGVLTGGNQSGTKPNSGRGKCPAGESNASAQIRSGNCLLLLGQLKQPVPAGLCTLSDSEFHDITNSSGFYVSRVFCKFSLPTSGYVSEGGNGRSFSLRRAEGRCNMSPAAGDISAALGGPSAKGREFLQQQCAPLCWRDSGTPEQIWQQTPTTSKPQPRDIRHQLSTPTLFKSKADMSRLAPSPPPPPLFIQTPLQFDSLDNCVILWPQWFNTLCQATNQKQAPRSSPPPASL